jgi:uncharacterized protein YfaP (DUF2135 family)
MVRQFCVAALSLGLTLGSLGCESDSPGSPTGPTRVDGSVAIGDILVSAVSGDADGVRRGGSAPAAGTGPRIAATGNQRVINGGTMAVALSGDRPFSAVYVFVGGRTLGLVGEAPGGIEGHYEIRLPSPQAITSVLLSFPQEIALEQFDLQFAVAEPSGAVGPYVGLPTIVQEVGTGDVQVTLSWDADSDVDLHVVAPNGEEIYYGRREGSNGAELDLDSNAACDIDGIRNENITWPVGQAPRGRYTVRVDYWDNCGVERTNYTVRVNNGGDTEIVTGFFTGAGDRGGAGSGRTVATFERTTGPAAVTASEPPLSVLSPLTAAKTLLTPKGSGK